MCVLIFRIMSIIWNIAGLHKNAKVLKQVVYLFTIGLQTVKRLKTSHSRACMAQEIVQYYTDGRTYTKANKNVLKRNLQ